MEGWENLEERDWKVQKDALGSYRRSESTTGHEFSPEDYGKDKLWLSLKPPSPAEEMRERVCV